MIYKFEIKESDISNKHWLIIKREEKTDGFYLEAKELNDLQIVINKHLDKLREDNGS